MPKIPEDLKVGDWLKHKKKWSNGEYWDSELRIAKVERMDDVVIYDIVGKVKITDKRGTQVVPCNGFCTTDVDYDSVDVVRVAWETPGVQ